MYASWIPWVRFYWKQLGPRSQPKLLPSKPANVGTPIGWGKAPVTATLAVVFGGQ